MTDEKLADLYITHPEAGSRTFHIFDPENNHRSLCRRYMMLRYDPRYCDPIEDDTRWHDGQDCKACFRKAGLVE